MRSVIQLPECGQWVGGRVGVLAVLSATVLSACAALPASTPGRQAKAPQSYASSQALSAPQGEWPADAWWTAYGDTQLDTLMQEALAGSPTLAVAQARVRRAESLTAQARAQGRPWISANGSVEEMKQSYNVGIPPEFVPHGYNAYGLLTL